MESFKPLISRLTQASSVLILTSGSSGDGLASGLALRAFLRKLEKEVGLLAIDAVSDRFTFLPHIEEVKSEVDLTKSFVIDVSTKKAPLGELSYKKEEDRLSIFIKPSSGQYEPQDVSFRTSNFPYELVVVLGLGSFEQLGNFYAQNTALFFETPVANIDFRATNENYGQINLINLSATSCSEIILDLINEFESSLLDETIATQLLAGIIAETNSFQHIRTTPQTFIKASQLVSLGAKQQDIIGSLYKTKSLGLLKLWGRVLAKLQQDEPLNLIYSSLNTNDIVRSGAILNDIENIIKEMGLQLTFAKISVFFAEVAPDQIWVYCLSQFPMSLPAVFEGFNPQIINSQTIKFVLNMSLVECENQILSLLRTEAAKFAPTT